jgi:DNA-binding MarR family transcriptional regulator
VAFTIELDNEFEHRMPHRTAQDRGHPGSGPWLVSAVMWSNCLRFLDATGMTVAELERAARTRTNLDGMRRWGYVAIDPKAAAASGRRVSPSAVVRPTERGRQAQAVWAPLFGEIERRWQDRFGASTVDRLRAGLAQVVEQMQTPLPDCLPILGYGLYSAPRVDTEPRPDGPAPPAAAALSLSALMSRTLLGFAVPFERRSRLSLAISADVVRVLNDRGVRVSDLPALGGVSTAAVSMAIAFLEKQGDAVVESVPAPGRGKLVRLTTAGLAAQVRYAELIAAVEDQRGQRFGAEVVGDVRDGLEALCGDGTRAGCRLFEGLTPHPDCWRASVRAPAVLPHFPMVLHRGGFPDGS